MQSTCYSFKHEREYICCHPNASSLAELQLSQLVELVPAVTCSFITTLYITQAERAQDINRPSQLIFRIVQVDFLKHVSPGLALGSCLVLGCCLSSYSRRRRDQDGYQAIIFIIWIIWAIWTGWGIGASTNMIMLGIMPWTLCAAMLSSFFGHAGVRWVSGREKRLYKSVFSVVDEKGMSLGA